MKNMLYCLLVALFAAAVSVNAQFPQAQRHQIKIDAAEKARVAKEKAERDRPVLSARPDECRCSDGLDEH